MGRNEQTKKEREVEIVKRLRDTGGMERVVGGGAADAWQTSGAKDDKIRQRYIYHSAIGSPISQSGKYVYRCHGPSRDGRGTFPAKVD